MALMQDIAPNVGPSYRQASTIAAGVMLISVCEELDRIAERRVVENAALRGIFGDAAPAVTDAALRARLDEAARSAEAGYRISQLDAENDRLRALLIELHAHVESTPGDAARRIEARIWRELAASTERRKLSLGAF
jgi:hypothetical protein